MIRVPLYPRLWRSLAPLFAFVALVPASVLQAQGQSKEYTIPVIDLAGEKERQTIVDRQAGQYLGHPTTVLLEDGKTMLCVYPQGHGSGAILYKRSADGGRTWSERLPTPASWATSKETPTLYRVTTPEGKKRLLLFSGSQTSKRPQAVRLSISDDDGRTFSELAPIGDYGGIVAMSSVVPLADGRLLALFHDDVRFWKTYWRDGQPPTLGKDCIVFKTLSADGGRTWSAPEPIARHPEAYLCEPGAIRSPDGKQIAVLLRENSRKFNSFVVFSSDEGKTWTAPRELPAALTGDRHVGRYAPDGRLFISFRDTAHTGPTRGDWVAWVGTWQDLVAGREGRYRVRLMDNTKGADCAYPGVELLPDGTLVATTYGHWSQGEAPYVVSVRLTLDELDEKARALPAANTAVIPAPVCEKDSFYNWQERHEAACKTIGKEPPELVFIGDSITHLFGGPPASSRVDGGRVWDRYYGGRKAVNLGFGWDRTQQVLWRLAHGEFDRIRPKAVVLLIGTNNLTAHAVRENTNEEIAAGVRAVCDLIQTRSPETRILLLGLLPRGKQPDDPLRARIREVNRLLAPLGERSGVTFLDVGRALLAEDGRFKPDIAPDFLHLNERGYRLWAEAMEPTLARLLGTPPLAPEK